MGMSCKGRIVPPGGGSSSGHYCGLTLYKCEKCGNVGCKNRKCPNYVGDSSTSRCGKCGGNLKAM